jgi:hypothetical protein
MTESGQAYIDRLQELYLEGGIDGVTVVAADATRCPTCGEWDQQVLMPSRLPALPIAGCTRQGGCRCRYEPNVTVPE